MPDWVWFLVIGDLAAAILLAFTIASLSRKGAFWTTFVRTALWLAMFCVVVSFLTYFGGWMLIRGIRGG